MLSPTFFQARDSPGNGNRKRFLASLLLLSLLLITPVLALDAMSLSITGPGQIVNKSQTQMITLTLTQTSGTADPGNVRLILSGLNYYVVNPAFTVCVGVVAPVSCTPVIVGDDYVWNFGNEFNGSGQTSTLQMDVQKRCTGSGDLVATAYYNDTFSVTAVETPLLKSGDLLIEITPEVYNATTDTTQWKINLTNRGNGTAYNIWLDDVLGSGLDYVSAVLDDMTGVTITDGQDHNGNPINGATISILQMAAGERREVTLNALLSDCNHLTNDVSASWGCIGVNCQTVVTDNATVEIPPSTVMRTNVITTPIYACSDPGGYITLRNPGQTTMYNLQISETMSLGLWYVSGTIRWRVNDGAWNGPDAAYDPTVHAQTFQWNANKIPALAAFDPGDTIEIEFDINADCSFNEGRATLSVSHENPCGWVVYDSDTIFPITITGCSGALMIVQGGSPQQDIVNGDDVPTTEDYTDFGATMVAGVTIDRTFEIENFGADDLTLSGTPVVAISGSHAADFTVIDLPVVSIPSCSNDTFTLRLNPSAAGLQTATVSIANNDPDKNPYTFSIQGTGLAPEMSVEGNSVVIADGDATPSADDHTDFGNADTAGSTVVRTFTIKNTGSANLTLTGTPKVEVRGTHAADFTVTTQPTTPVVASEQSSFQVTFNPSATGVRTATLSIANDDTDENPYNFAVQGTGTTPAPPSSQGGGGGYTIIAAVDRWSQGIRTGENVTLSFDETAIYRIVVTAETDIPDLMVSTLQATRPGSIPAPNGTVSGYVELTLYKVTYAAIRGVVIEFTVPLSWLAENGFEPAQVVLLRWQNGEWQEFPTEFVREDTGTAYYRAESPGLSLFAISAMEKSLPAQDTIAAEGTVTPGIGTTTVPETDLPLATEPNVAETTAPVQPATPQTPLQYAPLLAPLAIPLLRRGKR